MPKFQIGEQARLKNRLVKRYNPCITAVPAGTAVRIIGLPGFMPEDHVLNELYQVEIENYFNSKGSWAAEKDLEKILGSWDEIEKTTGFKPSKDKERKKEHVYAQH